MSFIPQIPNDWLESQTKLIKQDTSREYIGIDVQLDYNPTYGIPIVYGLQRLEPPVIYLSTKFGDSNTLYAAYCLGEGQMGKVFRVYVDDNMVIIGDVNTAFNHNTISKPAPGDRLRPGVNSSDELAVFEYIDGRSGPIRSELLREVYNSQKDPPFYRDTAYMVVRYKYNASVFRGLPKLTVDVWGIGETKNPVSNLLDYLQNTRYGAAIAAAQIDTASFTAVSNAITTNLVKYSATDTNGEPFLQNNITLDPTQTIQNNINLLTNSFGLIFYYANGKYRLALEGRDNSYTDITESDILDGVEIVGVNAEDKYNQFTVDYMKQDVRLNVFTMKEATEPNATLASQYYLEDNRQLRRGRLEARAIGYGWLAQQTARKLLLKSRNQKTYRFRMVKEGYQFTVGDILRVTTSVPSLTNQLMRIVRLRVNSEFTIDLECVTHDNDFYPPFADIYSTSTPTGIWQPPDRPAPTPIITPPNPGDPYPAPGEPGAPPPQLPPPQIFPGELWTMNTIRTPFTSLSRGSPEGAWPTLTGNTNFYLGHIYVQKIVNSVNWSTPLNRNTTTAFQPTSNGLTGKIDFSGYSNTVKNYSFGIQAVIDKISGLNYSSPTNTVYTFKQVPTVTFRYQDLTSAGISDVVNGKYKIQDFLIFVYTIDTYTDGATKTYGWIRKNVLGSTFTYVTDLENTREVLVYVDGSSKPQKVDYFNLISQFPRMKYVRNSSGYGGGAYGEIDPGDGTTHVQIRLDNGTGQANDVSCQLNDRLGWRHFGGLTTGTQYPVNFKIYSIADTSGLPEYLGSCVSTNDIRVANSSGSVYASRSQTNYRLALPKLGDLGTPSSA